MKDNHAPDSGALWLSSADTDLQSMPHIDIIAPGQAQVKDRSLRALWKRVTLWKLPDRPVEWIFRGTGMATGAVGIFAFSHVGCLVPLGVAFVLPTLSSDELRSVSNVTGLLSIALGTGLTVQGLKKDSCCDVSGEATGKLLARAAYMAGAVISITNGVSALTTDPTLVRWAAQTAFENGESIFKVMANICTSGTVRGLTP